MLPLAELRLIGVLLLVAAIATAFGLFVRSERQQGAALVTAQYAAAAASANEAARVEEQRRVAAQAEIANEAQRLSNHARDVSIAGVPASRKLRDDFRAAGSSCTGNPAVASSSPPGVSADDLRADVLGELDQRASDLALAADLSRIAGQQCERSYDALTK